jgi:hypothetical protein
MVIYRGANQKSNRWYKVYAFYYNHQGVKIGSRTILTDKRSSSSTPGIGSNIRAEGLSNYNFAIVMTDSDDKNVHYKILKPDLTDYISI